MLKPLNISKLLPVALLITTLLGCQKDEPVMNELYVNPELQPYFDLFVEEAAARGISVDLVEEEIEGYIQNIADRDVIGQCAYNANAPSKVTIDSPYWNRSDDFEKEFVVFHELGHCILTRDHLDESNGEGHCLSIMHSGLGDCEFTYNSANRDTYLDELFSR